MLSRLLRSAGHEVTHAGTVAAALAAASRGGLDLLISDIGLPDGTGMDLVKQLPAELRSRAIAVSGFGTEEDIAQSRDAGFATHLTKPLSVDTLLSTIDRVAVRAGPVC
jgi:DNA-binding response OmpR family regulator